MPVETLTPPVELPLDISDVEEWIRIDEGGETGLVTKLISAVTVATQKHLGRQLITATFRLRTKKFRDVIELPRPPLQQILENGIKYRDGDDVEQTFDGSFEVVNFTEPGYIRFYNFPASLSPTHEYPVSIDYKAGYGNNAVNVPEDIKVYMKGLIGTFYAKRETLGNTGEQDLVRIFRSFIANQRVYKFS